MASQLYLLTVFLVFICISVFAVPGGWTKVDVNSDEVKSEASFAVQTKFPGTVVDYVVIQAYKQVVAGLKFDLTVEVQFASGCKVNHFQVWDRFGSKTLAESDELADKCVVFH